MAGMLRSAAIGVSRAFGPVIGGPASRVGPGVMPVPGVFTG